MGRLGSTPPFFVAKVAARRLMLEACFGVRRLSSGERCPGGSPR